jgi:hypothetical protein
VKPQSDWQPAFVAVSVMLGETPQGALDILSGIETAGATGLVRELASASRDGRARILARITTTVVASLDAPGAP